MPKAQTFRCFRSNSPTRWKYWASFSFEAGIAALDVIEAQVVQPLGQFQLVLQRETDPLGLRAVAERRVVNFDASHESTCQL